MVSMDVALLKMLLAAVMVRLLSILVPKSHFS